MLSFSPSRSLPIPLPTNSVPGQPEDWSEINLALLSAADPGLGDKEDEDEEVAHQVHSTRQDGVADPDQNLHSDQDQDLSAQDITDAFPWTNKVNLFQSLYVSITQARTV
jgi:hypothetical protein